MRIPLTLAVSFFSSNTLLPDAANHRALPFHRKLSTESTAHGGDVRAWKYSYRSGGRYNAGSISSSLRRSSLYTAKIVTFCLSIYLPTSVSPSLQCRIANQIFCVVVLVKNGYLSLFFHLSQLT